MALLDVGSASCFDASPCCTVVLARDERADDTLLVQRQVTKVGQPSQLSVVSRSRSTRPNIKDIITQSLLFPTQITKHDPSILFTTLNMILVNRICYSFFESFPLVYPPMYGFDTLQTNLIFS